MYDLFLLNEIYTNGYRVEILDIVSLVAILSSILVIISKNPIVSVLFLIGLFLSISSYLIILGINFIGLSYILVYVGAVSILFLFILMLINIRISELLRENHNDIPLAILTVIITYYIVAQVLPTNLTDNTVFSRLSNSFTEIYNIKLDNEFINMLEFKQIGYASSKG